MKTKNQIILRLVLAAVMVLAGGVASLLGYAEFHYQLGGTHVAVYPALLLALIGLVQIWRVIITGAQQA